jgi:hypothetical protein
VDLGSSRREWYTKVGGDRLLEIKPELFQNFLHFYANSGLFAGKKPPALALERCWLPKTACH